MKTMIAAGGSALALLLSACGSTPEPFTVKQQVVISFVGVGILTMTPSDCDRVKTDHGVWKTSTPVIFRQDGTEVGTGDVTSSLSDASGGVRSCDYDIIGKVTPKNGDDITAELPNGYEWTKPVDDWKEADSVFMLDLTADPSDAG